MKISDSNEQRMISNQGLIQYLNVGDESLYVGGVPNSIKDRITKQLLHVRNSSSYRGCMLNLYINSELKNLQQTEYNHKISSGCSYLESCNQNIDSVHKKCYNGGTCKSLFSLNSDFTCQCTNDFTGNTCEIPVKQSAEPQISNYNSNGLKSVLKTDDQITIQKQQQQQEKSLNKCSHSFLYDFYTDSKTGCKSKKRLPFIKCTGSCKQMTNEEKQPPSFAFLIGTNKKAIQRSITTPCCQPVRTKPKKIKLFCSDGSTILADISLPRKCFCSNENKCNNNV